MNKTTDQVFRVSKRNALSTSIVSDIQFRLRNKAICDAALGGGAIANGAAISLPGSGGMTWQAGQSFDVNMAQTGQRVIQINSITLVNVQANAIHTADVLVTFARLDNSSGGNSAGATATFQRRLPIKLNNTANYIADSGGPCMDIISEYEIGLARMLCRDICENEQNGGADAECQIASTASRGYERCQIAIQEALNEMEEELCESMGVWDGTNCQPLYSNTPPCELPGDSVSRFTSDSPNAGPGSFSCRGTASTYGAGGGGGSVTTTVPAVTTTVTTTTAPVTTTAVVTTITTTAPVSGPRCDIDRLLVTGNGCACTVRDSEGVPAGQILSFTMLCTYSDSRGSRATGPGEVEISCSDSGEILSARVTYCEGEGQ